MKEIDAIFDKIDQEGDIREIRYAIADLIVNRLNKVRNSLGYWEKVHLASAIATLAQNINLPHQPTTFWLRVCLVNIEKALVPPNQRNENYVPKDRQLDSLTFDQLMSAINEVWQGR